MLDIKLGIRTEAEAGGAKVRADILASDISEPERAFLLAAVSSTLGQWGAQMSRSGPRSLRAEKRFEGAGYRVVLTAKPDAGGFGGALARLFGRRA